MFAEIRFHYGWNQIEDRRCERTAGTFVNRQEDIQHERIRRPVEINPVAVNYFINSICVSSCLRVLSRVQWQGFQSVLRPGRKAGQCVSWCTSNKKIIGEIICQ